MKQALQGTQLANATDHQLNNTLAVIYAMIGLREQHFPTPQEDVLLFAFIRSEFGAKTLDELMLAFKLAIKNELEIEDAKVYDQFTCEYIARIMTAYRKWLKKVNKEVEPERKMIMHNTITTQEDKLKDIAEWEAKTEIRLEYIPPYIFDYLREFGKIGITDEVRNQYMTKAKEIIKTEMYNEWQDELSRKIVGAGLTYKKFMIMYEEKKWTPEYLSKFRNLAKKIIVFEYLTDLKK